MFLLYEDDFYNVFNDAERILHEYSSKREVNLKKLSFEKFEYKPAIEIFVSPEEWVLNLNSNKVRLYEVSAKKELYE